MSKCESADTVASISKEEGIPVKKVPGGARRQADVEDHGSLLAGSPSSELTNKSSSSAPPGKPREAFSPGARPVPRARTFLEDSDAPASDPKKLAELENSAPVPLLGQPSYLTRGGGGGGSAGATTEIEELQEDWDAALGRRSGTKASGFTRTT